MRKIYLFAVSLIVMGVAAVMPAKAENRTLEGTFYYNYDYANPSKTVTIVDNGDATYTLKNLYNEGYDVTFSVNADSTVCVVGLEKDDYGYYNIPIGPGEDDILATYTGGGYSYAEASADRVDFEWGHYEGDDWVVERVCWTSQWTVEGSFGYNYDWTNEVYESTKDVTMISNGGGKYTLKNVYADGYDVELIPETDGSVAILNATYGEENGNGYYYLYYGEGENDFLSVYPWGTCSYFIIADGWITTGWYRYDAVGNWGSDDFWAESAGTGISAPSAKSGSVGDGVKVYDAAGRLEYSGNAAGMGSLKSGLHIVKSSDGVRKVAVK